MSRSKHPVRALVGTDFSAWCKQVGEKLDRENDARIAKQREAAARHVYEGNDNYRVRVEKVLGGYQARTLEHPPLVGELRARGRTEEHAVKELRMAFAIELHKRKLLHTLDEARDYCARATFVRELVFTEG